MLALGIVRIVFLAVGGLVVLRRTRTADGERAVWQAHTAGVAVLVVGACLHLVLDLAGTTSTVAVLAFALTTLPACLLFFLGLSRYHRLHSPGGEPTDWLVGAGAACAVAAAANLLVQTGLVSTALGGVVLQYRLLTIGAIGVVTVAVLSVARAAGVPRAPGTVLLATALLAVLGCQVWILAGGAAATTRIGLAVTWISVVGALAYCAHLSDDLPRPIRSSPSSTTAAAVGTVLAAVAVITATTLQPGPGELRWSVVWAVLAVLGPAERISRLVRRLVHHDRLRQEAATDDLTGLANRRAFAEALAAVTANATRTPASVLLVDLDRFKEINDRHGHATGDRLLQHVGRGFTTVLPAGAVLGRLGGDEFAVLLRHRSADDGAEQALAIAHRLVSVARRFPLDGVHVVGCSIGVVTTDGASAVAGEELMRRADAAMYVAKAAGGGVARHDEAADRRLRRRAVLTDDLLEAVAGRDPVLRNQFEVHYQPQVEVRTGRTAGVEALVRWRHPVFGLLLPAEFLDIAEERGLLSELTALVLGRASEDLAAWRALGHEPRLSFNVSAGQLTDPRLLVLLDEVVATGTAPSRLVVEVTESMLVQDPERVLRTCRQITARGCSLSIDDFGTGYSSLAQLAVLPVQELKVDRSFTARLLTDPRTAAIVAGTVDLAHHLGLTVVAEGVEDEATLQVLRDLGCELSQGFLHSRPVPFGELRLAGSVHTYR